MTAIGPFQNENGIKLEFQNALLADNSRTYGPQPPKGEVKGGRGACSVLGVRLKIRPDGSSVQGVDRRCRSFVLSAALSMMWGINSVGVAVRP
jgi:hypothetical protein